MVIVEGNQTKEFGIIFHTLLEHGDKTTVFLQQKHHGIYFILIKDKKCILYTQIANSIERTRFDFVKVIKICIEYK